MVLYESYDLREIFVELGLKIFFLDRYLRCFSAFFAVLEPHQVSAPVPWAADKERVSSK